ncbi:hypothetical protein [Glaesserella parasuis]|uniref:hypothetical protein n=1 Tax=Glaesserella parasuis TaxID=738 RepID=UPI00103F73CF|nr:hypothetical protein [Glaesserella parasuis]
MACSGLFVGADEPPPLPPEPQAVTPSETKIAIAAVLTDKRIESPYFNVLFNENMCKIRTILKAGFTFC